jgi:hypothetical protein
MTFELPRTVVTVPLPFLIVCEGYSDLRLLDELLQHHGIGNCSIGCPSRDFGKGSFPGYMRALRAVLDIQAITLRGVLIIVDADSSRAGAFANATAALREGGFPVPASSFAIEELNPRVAVYIMPGEGRDGTLEHLLLDAAYRESPQAEECTSTFFECIGGLGPTPNQEAKMRLSSLIGATCKDNPWSSAAMIWRDTGNPVPINSPSFDHIVDFIRRFSS